MQAQDVAIKPNVKVIMKSDTEMLDEVMVIAYGTTKKESFTGSAEVIKSEKLKRKDQLQTLRKHWTVWLPVCKLLQVQGSRDQALL